MLSIKITKMDKEAFSDGNCTNEVVRILKVVVARIEAGETFGNCNDLNDNKVGEWDYAEPETDEDDENS